METWRRGDAEIGRTLRRVSVSPYLRISVSPCLRVSVSPRLRVSVSPRLRVSASPRHRVSVSPRLPRLRVSPVPLCYNPRQFPKV